MITEQDLREAIAECQGQRNPNASTAIKLASFYTILDHITDDSKLDRPQAQSYSFAPPPTVYDSGTDFSDRIQGMDMNEVLAVMDELMTTLSVVNPRLYDAVLRKL